MTRKTILSELVYPLENEEFLRDYYQNGPLHLNGAAGRFRNLFSWRSVSEILNSAIFPHPQMKMHREGRPINFTNPQQLINQLREGTTLIIENADSYYPPLAQFVDRFSFDYLTPARTNAYISFPGVQAYDFHYDTHDFFILQASGKKTWHVYPKTINSPLYYAKTHSTEAPSGDPILTVTLTEGDVLYVPKGYWHYAVATEEPSIHLTLALFVRTRLDLLNWVLGECREDPVFRAELPLFTQSEAPTGDFATHPYQSELELTRKHLCKMLDDPNICTAFMKYVSAHLTHRERFSFPFDFAEASELIMKYGTFRRLPILPYIDFGSMVTISFHGQSIEIDKKFTEVIRLIFYGPDKEIVVNELSKSFATIPVRELQTLLGTLSREGLLLPIDSDECTSVNAVRSVEAEVANDLADICTDE